MDSNPIPSPQPQTNPQPQPVIPMPTPPVTPTKPKNVLLTVLIVIVVLLSLGAAGFFAYRYIQQKQQAAITTFEECTKASGNMIQTIYPATCVTRDGRRFTQPLTDEEQQNLLPPVDNQNFLSCNQPCNVADLPYECQAGLACLGITKERSLLYPGQGVTNEVVCRNPQCQDKTNCICEDSGSTYTCPANGWVDCLPGPDPKPECSSSAMSWYKANCPNFKGAAL
jgi:hypothetical protein